jgi:CPA1 family monovalent cation:H+ antiporter
MAVQDLALNETGQAGLTPGGLVEGFALMDEQERDFTLARVARKKRTAQKQARDQRKSERKAAIIAERRSAHADPRYWRLHLRDALLLSLTGAKGAITLAVLLTIPITLTSGAAFPERDLILFLASGVILLSLLITNIAVPLIAPRKKAALPPESELSAMLDIYRTVIYQLAESVGDANKAATNEVIRHYTTRLQALRETNDFADPIEDRLRLRVIDWEVAHTLELIDEGTVSTVVGLLYLNQLSHIKARIEHHNPLRWEARAIIEQLRHRLRHRGRNKKTLQQDEASASNRVSRRDARFELRGLIFENLRHAIDQLTALRDDEALDKAECKVAEQMIAEFRRRLDRGTRSQVMPNSAQQTYEAEVLAVQTRALAFERDAVELALAKGLLSHERAKLMRDNVAMMELDIEQQLE